MKNCLLAVFWGSALSGKSRHWNRQIVCFPLALPKSNPTLAIPKKLQMIVR